MRIQVATVKQPASPPVLDVFPNASNIGTLLIKLDEKFKYKYGLGILV
jgi:hypothetical protein